ncbi:small integral membrane protein 31-like isoform X1 [Conger conger]|uniref:small integral membrane protein 31-like isoform X1 n=1 Tax=Conger conger TaxID=82655 RepID=UPI002A5ADE45|nr:small integral membrane protein 31-like isoform X1 [Conger conger]
MANSERSQQQDWSSMALPFTNFEIAFILIAFIVVTLFSLASVFSQPNTKREEDYEECFKTTRVRKTKQKGVQSVPTVKDAL